jgi:signal transduction histidine kinase
MRTTADLERITPLIWKELTILHVPFIRCGVFIMHEVEAQTHVYLSTPDGKAIAAFHLPYSNRGFMEGVLRHWRNHQVFTDHWDAAAFSEWTKSLLKQGAIKSDEKYGNEIPPENLYLHFLPFMQGMLYVGSMAPLKEDELALLQALAEAFSTAYARYEDFTKLDMAKQQIETTLVELKATQAQLIQKEKMASLGELTAGIAHEIQNPLNFVNNFSETNVELLEELEQELIKGNTQEAKALANDAKENECKINQHGRRADAIVKAMMQHARTSTGEKQPINFNALMNEYIKLAYHGFKAKDKTFHATIETHYDEAIGTISIVPQDIGRVLLNLFNNAFYAVNEKKKAIDGSYEPMISVSTHLLHDKVQITVQDNGGGIPQNVIDKIFQPFFTTKPTGEGTGLGLSLSYDIVKAHGGELKVESTEGEGATFIVILPRL